MSPFARIQGLWHLLKPFSHLHIGPLTVWTLGSDCSSIILGSCQLVAQLGCSCKKQSSGIQLCPIGVNGRVEMLSATEVDSFCGRGQLCLFISSPASGMSSMTSSAPCGSDASSATWPFRFCASKTLCLPSPGPRFCTLHYGLLDGVAPLRLSRISVSSVQVGDLHGA